MNIKELAERILGVDFNFDIKETATDGVFVRYNGKTAEVGGATVPMLARAYMRPYKGRGRVKQSAQNHSFARGTEVRRYEQNKHRTRAMR